MVSENPHPAARAAQQAATAAHGRGVLARATGHAFSGVLIGGFLGYYFLPFLLHKLVSIDELRRYAAPLGFDFQSADMPWICAAIGAAAFGVLQAAAGLANDALSARRDDGIQEAARRIGARMSASPDADLIARLRRFFPENAGLDFRNVVRLQAQGIHVTAGDVAWTKAKSGSDGDSSTTVQTVAFYESDAFRFPRFTLQPEGVLTGLVWRVVGIQDIDFSSHPEFSKAYHLSADDEEDARKLFNDRLLEDLGRRQGLHIESAPAGLMMYRPGVLCGPEELNELGGEAAAIFRLFEDAARASGLTADRPRTKQRDVRAMVAKMPGLMGIMARQDLVTRADVEAFVRQPPPRKITGNIRNYPERFGGEFVAGIGLIFALGGTGLAFGFGHQAAMSGKGLMNSDWFGVPFGLLFVAVGAPIAFFAGRTRYRIRRALRHGRLATATIESVEATGTSINSSDVVRLTVRYGAGGRDTRATCKIIGPGVERAQKLAADRKPAAILYDPADPQRILFVDDLISVGMEYEP